LIALISNARHFIVKNRNAVGGALDLSDYSARRALLRKTRSRDKPNRAAVTTLRRAAHTKP